MGKLIDLTGRRFGRVIVYERVKNDDCRRQQWQCICDCGKEFTEKGTRLRRGEVKSCGCLEREKIEQENTEHSLTWKRLYRIWRGMRESTENPESAMYRLNGGRGIKLCEEWKDFQTFYDWSLRNGYNDDDFISRYNQNYDYCTFNCYWKSARMANRY